MDLRLPTRTPRYASIAQEILLGVEDGRYKVGALLPTEVELCKLFNVSRVTVRGALRELELRGFISRQAGVGTRVDRATSRDRFVHESSSIEDVLQFTQELAFRRLSEDEFAADAAFASRAECAVGDRFVRVVGLRVAASERPVCHSTHFIPVEFASGAERIDGLKGSLATAIAARFSLEIEEIAQTIEAENLSAALAETLEAKAREAALVTWRCYRVRGGRLLLAARSVFPKDRYSYSIKTRRDWSLPDVQGRTA